MFRLKVTFGGFIKKLDRDLIVKCKFFVFDLDLTHTRKLGKFEYALSRE